MSQVKDDALTAEPKARVLDVVYGTNTFISYTNMRSTDIYHPPGVGGDTTMQQPMRSFSQRAVSAVSGVFESLPLYILMDAYTHNAPDRNKPCPMFDSLTIPCCRSKFQNIPFSLPYPQFPSRVWLLAGATAGVITNGPSEKSQGKHIWRISTPLYYRRVDSANRPRTGCYKRRHVRHIHYI